MRSAGGSRGITGGLPLGLASMGRLHRLGEGRGEQSGGQQSGADAADAGRPAGAVEHLAEHEAADEAAGEVGGKVETAGSTDRKSTRLNSSHVAISYAVFCL